VQHPPNLLPPRQVVLEIALVFAVFLIQGAAPVPEVNEPYYLGKAIHFWNPDWVRSDFFLDTADTHIVFYLTFGWLALALSPQVMAWTGRLLTWALLAWAWRRLSYALVPRPWFAVLTAALWVLLIERCHMAGEWVIGGVEAKGFAYVLVLLGLEALVHNRWNRVWLLLGAASAFHVLVGGWSVVAAGWAWLAQGGEKGTGSFCAQHPQGPLGKRCLSPFPRPTLLSMAPALIGGLLLSLPGLVPLLLLNRGVDQETMDYANLIYVYARLPHHLVIDMMPLSYVLRFAALIGFFLLLGLLGREGEAPAEPRNGGDSTNNGSAARHTSSTRQRMGSEAGDSTHPLACASSLYDGMQRFRAFVGGTILIALVGAAITPIQFYDRQLGAALLRFYWFRLADVAVPMGVALGVGWLIATRWEARPRLSTAWLSVAATVAVLHVGSHAIERMSPIPPPADRSLDYVAWRRACDWIVTSGEVPPDARFLTPRMSQTLKWYTGRAEVGNWKEVPQNARGLVAWWKRMHDLHATGHQHPDYYWHYSLTRLRPERLRRLAREYEADYLITRSQPWLPFERLYANRSYAVYRLAPSRAE